MRKFFILFCLVIPSTSFAENLAGIIVGKYANVRSNPTVVNSSIITKLYRGSAIRITDKTSEKIKIGDIEGFWYKIEAIETGEKGWIIDKYVALEGDSQIQDYIHSVITSFYYYRSNLDDQLQDIKKNVGKKNALEQLKSYNPRFLNYIAYHLLAQRNVLAIPVLIAFMNPDYKEENSKDANYNLTWEILERLTPKVLITNNYHSFQYWWQRNEDSMEINLSSYELATIFKKIQENENRIYRKLSGPLDSNT